MNRLSRSNQIAITAITKPLTHTTLYLYYGACQGEEEEEENAEEEKEKEDEWEKEEERGETRRLSRSLAG